MQKHDLETTYAAWYSEYADGIFRFCLMKTSNRDVALDLTQDAFMKLWDSARTGTYIENPRALLYTISRNSITDYYRKKKTDSLDALTDAGIEFGESGHVESASDYQHALSAINALEEPYREAVYLRYVEELKPRVISEITGDSVNVISVRITRGMQELRKRLSKGET